MSSIGPTLCIDVGSSSVRSLLVDGRGEPCQPVQRDAMKRLKSPSEVVEAIIEVANGYKNCDRIAVGVPWVVVDDVVKAGPGVGHKWHGFPLGRELRVRLERRVKVANSTDLRGLGVVRSKGVEVVLTLGTGLGSALFNEGRLVPNFCLGHLSFNKKRSFEEYVGRPALDTLGAKRWSKRVLRLLEHIEPLLNPEAVYLDGSNAKSLKTKLPPKVRLVTVEEALAGGFRIFD